MKSVIVKCPRANRRIEAAVAERPKKGACGVDNRIDEDSLGLINKCWRCGEVLKMPKK